MRPAASPPPLSLPLSAHPRYSDIIKSARAGGAVLDVGAGLGKDVVQLLKDGAVSVCALDQEAQYAPLLAMACRRNSVDPDKASYVCGDILSLLYPSWGVWKLSPSDDLRSWREQTTGTFSVIVCNRLLPLLPDSPTQTAALVSALLTLLNRPDSGHTALLVGLQRALPSGVRSSWRPISAASAAGDTARHWLWSHDEFETVLEDACAKERIVRDGFDVRWGSEYLGAEEGRGAERWWISVENS